MEFVWRKYPEFSAKNTILIDDSVEKARYNPAFTSIHPPAFLGFERKNTEKVKYEGKKLPVDDGASDEPGEACVSDKQDNELHLSFGLGSYLMKLADVCKSRLQNEPGVDLDVREFLRETYYV